MSLDYILLGLLQRPTTGYELKRVFDGTTRYFWGAELSQIYNTLRRLEREGLLVSRNAPPALGPERRIYSTNAQGRKRLRAWLAQPPQFGQERFTYLAQLFFMNASNDRSRTLRFLADLRVVFRDRLCALRQIEAEQRTPRATKSKMTNEEFHRYLSLRAGIVTMEARLRWCTESITSVRERMTPQPQRRRAHRKGAKK